MGQANTSMYSRKFRFVALSNIRVVSGMHITFQTEILLSLIILRSPEPV